MQITIAKYLLQRLEELGIKHLFGVPGDYNLNFLDYIEDSKSIEWMGTCNELNAAYAADGYGRINGAAALLTTNGVGELSAINGLAGSNAENVAVVHIVGMPSTQIQQAHLPNHHTFADGDYTKFIRMQKLITSVQEVIKLNTATNQIDHALSECYLQQKPVVIGVAFDLFDAMVTKPDTKLNLHLAKSDPLLEVSQLKIVLERLKNARQPLIIIDAKSRNHSLIIYAKKLIDKSKIPYVTTLMAKGYINEDNPHFLGEYFGRLSSQYVLDYVNTSDLIIWFGRVDTDLNSAGYSTVHDYTKMLRIEHSSIAVFNQAMLSLNGIEFTSLLLKNIGRYKDTYPVHRPTPANNSGDSLNQETFWHYAHELLKPDSTIITDAGTCIYGLFNKQLPENAIVINQLLWGSIGYSVGATLGILAAAIKPNTYLFVGDGAFQLTAQEISTMLRHKYTPVIFLINNNGYTIERYIHGFTRKYNDIAIWDYCALVKSFNGPLKTWKINNLTQLQNLQQELDEHDDKLRFVEIIMNKEDVPILMKQVFAVK